MCTVKNDTFTKHLLHCFGSIYKLSLLQCVQEINYKLLYNVNFHPNIFYMASASAVALKQWQIIAKVVAGHTPQLSSSLKEFVYLGPGPPRSEGLQITLYNCTNNIIQR